MRESPGQEVVSQLTGLQGSLLKSRETSVSVGSNPTPSAGQGHGLQRGQGAAGPDRMTWPNPPVSDPRNLVTQNAAAIRKAERVVPSLVQRTEDQRCPPLFWCTGWHDLPMYPGVGCTEWGNAVP